MNHSLNDCNQSSSPHTPLKLHSPMDWPLIVKLNGPFPVISSQIYLTQPTLPLSWSILVVCLLQNQVLLISVLLLWLLPHSFLIPLPHLPVFLLLVLRLLVRVQLSLPEPFKSCPCIRRNVSPYSSSNLEQTRGVLSSQRRSLFCIIYVKYASLSVNNNHSARLFETSAIDLFHFFLTQAGIK